MKKYIVYLAAVTVMFATACNKEEIAAPISTEFISVELNPMTKTQLNGLETEWSAGDAVDVYVGSNKIGTLTLKEGSDNRFEGNIEEGKSGKATLKYPAGVTAVPTTQAAVAGSFANGAALLEGSTTIEDLRAGNGATLENKTALLQFTVAKAGDVSFEVGSNKYTVTGCQTDKTYYACVAPASNASFVARIGGYLSKQASNNVSFTANKIANLGSLPAPEKFSWGLVGQHQGWDITKPTEMYKVYDGTGDNNVNDVYAVLDVKLSDNGFKFAKFGLSNWNSSNTYFGAWTKSSGKQYYNFTEDCGLGNWYGMWTDSCAGQSENIGVDDWNQKYDVYIKMTEYYPNSQNMNYTIVKAGTAMTF